MVDLPVWIYADRGPKGGLIYREQRMPDTVAEYVRADLYEQVKRERDDARETGSFHYNAWLKERDLKLEMVEALKAAECLAGARVVTDAMVAAFQDKYREFWKGSWPDTETSRELLKAALAEPAGEAEPVAWRYKSPAKGSKWTVQKNYPESVSKWAGYVIQPLYTTPPDASAIRGALDIPECVLSLCNDKITMAFETSEDATCAFDAIDAALAGAKP